MHDAQETFSERKVIPIIALRTGAMHGAATSLTEPTRVLWYSILIWFIVATSSAWAGLEEEATVDEAEAVRNNQRGASRAASLP